MSHDPRDWTPNDQTVSPAVIGAEYESSPEDQLAGHAFVPSQRASLSDGEVTLELRQTEEGLLAMLAFSSLELLVSGCGHAQPWVAVPMERVEELQRQCGAEVVLWDVAIPPDLRHFSE